MPGIEALDPGALWSIHTGIPRDSLGENRSTKPVNEVIVRDLLTSVHEAFKATPLIPGLDPEHVGLPEGYEGGVFQVGLTAVSWWRGQFEIHVLAHDSAQEHVLEGDLTIHERASGRASLVKHCLRARTPEHPTVTAFEPTFEDIRSLGGFITRVSSLDAVWTEVKPVSLLEALRP